MRLTLAISAALMSAAAVHAADPPTVGQLYDNQLRGPEGEVLSLAEAMPAEKYSFAPTKGEFTGARTFLQQVTHIATTNYMVCGAVLQEKPDFTVGEHENGPANIKTKDQAVKYLKESFSYCHRALVTLTSENQVEMVPSPFGQGQMARGAAAAVPMWHTFDHYGQMAVYARMNGVVPPASK
jgi:uncharacterized damage-inducible protein DinB